MNLINLTPHAIVIIGDDDKSTVVPTCGDVVRCAVTSEPAGEFAGIPLSRTTFGEVVGLPDPQPDTLYIVSMIVRNAVPDRKVVARTEYHCLAG